MENNNDNRQGYSNQDGQEGQGINFTPDNKDLKNDANRDNKPDGLLPEDDPALINPDELATFPKPVETDENVDIDAERDSHLVNRRSPVRDGRNITSTDNNPNRDGFM
jgi:hypothetical protein